MYITIYPCSNYDAVFSLYLLEPEDPEARTLHVGVGIHNDDRMYNYDPFDI